MSNGYEGVVRVVVFAVSICFSNSVFQFILFFTKKCIRVRQVADLQLKRDDH